METTSLSTIQRIPLNSDAIDRWAGEVTQVIDQVALNSYSVAFDPSVVPEVKPTMLCGPTSQSVSDFLLAHRTPETPPAHQPCRSMDFYIRRKPSLAHEDRTAHLQYREVARLTDWRRSWARTSGVVRSTILDLVQRATSHTTRKRPTSAQMSSTLKHLLDEVFSLHSQCQLMRLPISDLTFDDPFMGSS